MVALTDKEAQEVSQALRVLAAQPTTLKLVKRWRLAMLANAIERRAFK